MNLRIRSSSERHSPNTILYIRISLPGIFHSELFYLRLSLSEFFYHSSITKRRRLVNITQCVLETRETPYHTYSTTPQQHPRHLSPQNHNFLCIFLYGPHSSRVNHGIEMRASRQKVLGLICRLGNTPGRQLCLFIRHLYTSCTGLQAGVYQLHSVYSLGETSVQGALEPEIRWPHGNGKGGPQGTGRLFWQHGRLKGQEEGPMMASSQGECGSHDSEETGKSQGQAGCWVGLLTRQ